MQITKSVVVFLTVASIAFTAGCTPKREDQYVVSEEQVAKWRLAQRDQQCIDALPQTPAMRDFLACRFAAERQYFVDMNSSGLDLYDLYVQKALYAAGQYDRGAITSDQFDLLNAQYWSEMGTALQQRANSDAMAEAARRQAIAAESSARASWMGIFQQNQPRTCTTYGATTTCR